MDLRDFKIGLEFWCSGRQWRCTDVGSRVVVAIRVDSAEMTGGATGGGSTFTRKLTRAEAEAIGWFDGPPYIVAETVFDEDSLEACAVTREQL